LATKFEKYDLTGKVALVTGGAGLLGRQHASALLESGATVVLADISINALAVARTTLLNESPSAQILTKVMDVSNPADIRRVAESLNGLRVDILINNAAIDPKVTEDSGLVDTSRMENFPLLQWEQQIAVGLTGAFLCSQVFGAAMARDGLGGVILNIASDLSVIAPDQRLYEIQGLSADQQPVKPVSYSVIKAGLVGLTRYLATYWATSGVRANALSPGGVQNEQGHEFVQKLITRIPMGRMASPDEYRATV